jgi:hypothetical protein
MAGKSKALDRLRQLSCWAEIILFLLAFALPSSSFQPAAAIAIIVIAILQFTALRHY